MLQITIACVGKIRETYLNKGLEEYGKRLSGYCRLNRIEVQDEKTPDSASAAEEDQIRRTEGSRLLQKLPEKAYYIALDRNGKTLDSIRLSGRIDELAVSGRSHLVFIIGGSLGLSADVSKRADFKLSFSAMTFPHQMMRVILLEQIYRSFKINRNETYHK